MLATFHFCFANGEWVDYPCFDYSEVEQHIGESRCGMRAGREVGFYIEWHSEDDQ